MLYFVLTKKYYRLYCIRKGLFNIENVYLEYVVLSNIFLIIDYY